MERLQEVVRANADYSIYQFVRSLRFENVSYHVICLVVAFSDFVACIFAKRDVNETQLHQETIKLFLLLTGLVHIRRHHEFVDASLVQHGVALELHLSCVQC